MREKWQQEWDDKIVYENDANDFYYEWIDFTETNLTDLFEQWFGVGIGRDIPVRIKVRKGSLFITVIREKKKE